MYYKLATLMVNVSCQLGRIQSHLKGSLSGELSRLGWPENHFLDYNN